MKHKKKILSEYFNAIFEGTKTFEIRKEDDCRYEVGDLIELIEVDEIMELTGRKQCVEIIYRLDSEDFAEGIKNGYVVFGIVLIPTWEEVVAAWNNVNKYRCDDEKTRLSVVQRDDVTVDVELDWYGMDGLKFTKDRFCIRADHTIVFKPIRKSEMFNKEQMEAINLTIRYLENKKK